MKRVSFEIAKIIKEAGYPQDYKNAEDVYTNLNGGMWVKPTYIEAWLWLWREKKVYFGVNTEDYPHEGMCLNDYEDRPYSDPEEAIENAIMYLVENDLLK